MRTRRLVRTRALFIACLGSLLIALAFATSCAPLAKPTETPTPTLTLTPIPPTDTPTPTPILPTHTPTPTPVPPTDTPIPPTEPPTPTPPPPADTPVSPAATRPAPPNLEGNDTYSYRVINVYPHDRAAFTQGLVYLDSVFYEGTGLYGPSSLRKVDPETGQVLLLRGLPAQFFGEGITVLGDRIYQLTWKSGSGFVYDRKSFEPVQTFSYPTEGWGLTHDGSRLIMSDGTDTLHFLNPDTLEETGQVQVRDVHGPVAWLNELEYVQGEVFANVWQTDLVARIDPQSGRVTGWIDLSDLLEPADYAIPVDVLNGIAYDAETDRLFVTGKMWPKLFEIELMPAGTGSP